MSATQSEPSSLPAVVLTKVWDSVTPHFLPSSNFYNHCGQAPRCSVLHSACQELSAHNRRFQTIPLPLSRARRWYRDEIQLNYGAQGAALYPSNTTCQLGLRVLIYKSEWCLVLPCVERRVLPEQWSLFIPEQWPLFISLKNGLRRQLDCELWNELWRWALGTFSAALPGVESITVGGLWAFRLIKFTHNSCLIFFS